MLKFKVFPDHCLYVVIGEGQASVAACMELFAHVKKHVPEGRAYNSLVDMRGFETLMNYQQSEKVLEGMARYDNPVERKSALLVAGPAQYGTGRMFEQMGRGQVAVAMRVVVNLAEASAWLSVSEPILADIMAQDRSDWITLGA